VIGTPGYIAPEQASGASLDPRGDVYSLGCVAWFLLTRTEVYGGPSAEVVLRAHIDQPIPTLRPLVTGWLPVDLEALIVRCLAKAPEDRPDARELARSLREIAIPAEHAWTARHAEEWWAEPRIMVASSTADSDTVRGDERLLVVNHEPPTVEPRSGADAKTLVARPT
jgi:serine/threonine protein kinase